MQSVTATRVTSAKGGGGGGGGFGRNETGCRLKASDMRKNLATGLTRPLAWRKKNQVKSSSTCTVTYQRVMRRCVPEASVAQADGFSFAQGFGWMVESSEGHAKKKPGGAGKQENRSRFSLAARAFPFRNGVENSRKLIERGHRVIGMSFSDFLFGGSGDAREGRLEKAKGRGGDGEAGTGRWWQDGWKKSNRAKKGEVTNGRGCGARKTKERVEREWRRERTGTDGGKRGWCCGVGSRIAMGWARAGPGREGQ